MTLHNMSKVGFTQREINDLLVLIHHARRDIAYGGDGSYVKDAGGENAPDKKEAKKAERAIEALKRVMLVSR